MNKVSTPWWSVVLGVGVFVALSGCAGTGTETTWDLSSWLQVEPATTEGDRLEAEPGPTVEEVEAAITSTKTLLDAQQKELRELLVLKADVNHRLQQFEDDGLVPMANAVEELQHRIDVWDTTVSGNKGAVLSQIATLTTQVQDAQDEVAVYAGQVPTLADQVDQNHVEHAALFTEFQSALEAYKTVLATVDQDVKRERERAQQQEDGLAQTLATQAVSQQEASKHGADIRALQKRLNQLHQYINSVRTSLVTDAQAMRVSLEGGSGGNVSTLLQAFEERFQAFEQRQVVQVADLNHRLQQVSAQVSLGAPLVEPPARGTTAILAAPSSTSSTFTSQE